MHPVPSGAPRHADPHSFQFPRADSQSSRVIGAVSFATGCAGQAANSQSGPTLPTEEPSGQIFASSVQAFGPWAEAHPKSSKAAAMAIAMMTGTNLIFSPAPIHVPGLYILLWFGSGNPVSAKMPASKKVRRKIPSFYIFAPLSAVYKSSSYLYELF
jgi:hypothetical protein